MSRSLIHHRYPPEINARITRLQALTTLVLSEVHIPDTGVTLPVIHPASIDDLLDEVVDDPEFNLPYWAEIWPSGIALASAILRESDVVRGKPVIELGCGVGITAAAAVMAGADLVATDYSPHSLQLTALTCLLAGQRIPQVRLVNWREPDADVLQPTGERWPVVMAADVLYEARDIEPVLAALDRMVAPDGLVWLAEPGREHAQTAIALAQTRGWDIASTLYAGPWPGSEDVVVRVHKMVKRSLAD